MEGRFDSIEACLSTLQKEHREAEHRLDDMDKVLLAANSRLTVEKRMAVQLSLSSD